MGFLIRVIIICFISFVPIIDAMSCYAQNSDEFQYERASLCMMMIKHPARDFGNEIQYVFSKMSVPSRFNDHQLGVRFVAFASNMDQVDNIDSFIKQVNLGKRCVSRWFNRDKNNGSMNMDLIRGRGLYNATLNDINVARTQLRGLSLLEDAGELLLNNTYLIMFDIKYIDKSVGWGIFKEVMNVSQNVYDIWNNNVSVDDNNYNPFVNANLSSINATLDDLKGFRVKVTSYLFQLEWDEETASTVYTKYYYDSKHIDKAKKLAFDADNTSFTMRYVGMMSNSSSETDMTGITTNEELITKVCTRAVDKNIADLQHKYPAFRIKAPIVSVSPIKAAIGLKEDVSESSRFEVLERRIDNKGHIYYQNVGIVKPIKGRISDNRFMAKEERSSGASFEYTEFNKVSGIIPFTPGMFLREIK